MNDYKNQNSQNFRVQGSQSQGSVAQGFPRNPLYVKFCKLHPRECRVGTDLCYQCGRMGQFSKKCPNNRQGNGNGEIEPNLHQRLR
ncbi:hypothetical protein H5410_061262 [Solanum commersonii]|uniref:CCHC-type domain-containing protein n=1 Tax=Solanum commersonii TaxID=4109 RepID=A0A9J5W8L8_SOLCO|nr:hypothetical protein H5410_061262 [Solanum commersonii]